MVPVNGRPLIDFALELFTVFEGQEVDDFTTSMGGVSLTYVPDRKYNPLFLKFFYCYFRLSHFLVSCI